MIDCVKSREVNVVMFSSMSFPHPQQLTSASVSSFRSKSIRNPLLVTLGMSPQIRSLTECALQSLKSPGPCGKRAWKGTIVTPERRNLRIPQENRMVLCQFQNLFLQSSKGFIALAIQKRDIDIKYSQQAIRFIFYPCCLSF